MASQPGNCYAAAEALYHILGGKASGWRPMVLRLNKGATHWWLEHTSGLRLDPSVQQFVVPPDYNLGRGCGFLTKRPSKAARKLMAALTWKG